MALSGAHPLLTGLVVFASAIAEAVIFVGALVPGTAIILAVSAVSGAANQSLWPLVLWATVGAALGGRGVLLGGTPLRATLGRRWPLSRHPELLERGSRFFERYGGKSVFLGRFVPGVKAIVPAVAGISDMDVPRFLAANLSSGLIWATIHIVPAALGGVLLSSIGAISGRLLAALAAAAVGSVLI